MAFRQRAVPYMMATLVGVTSGIYIFEPLFKRYSIDSRGTFDPELARASAAGGAGGGAILPKSEAAATAAARGNSTGDTDESTQGIVSNAVNAIKERQQTFQREENEAIITGKEARQKLKGMMGDAPR